MTYEPFHQWLQRQRKKRGLSYEQCMNRINAKWDTDVGHRTWLQWEKRDKEDIPRERCYKIAHALQMPERDVLIAARLLPDDFIAGGIIDIYTSLPCEQKQVIDALVQVLHSQTVQPEFVATLLHFDEGEPE